MNTLFELYSHNISVVLLELVWRQLHPRQFCHGYNQWNTNESNTIPFDSTEFMCIGQQLIWVKSSTVTRWELSFFQVCKIH